jgi:hypothetical protein
MRFTIKGIIVLSLLVLFCRHGILAQTITVSIGTVSDCSNQVAVPVEVSAFNHVGAVSLVLAYNEQELTYRNYRNLNENLLGGLLVVNASNGRAVISWVNTSPASMDDGVFLELEFEKLQYGSSSLVWDTSTTGNCELSDGSGQSIEAVFQNGSYTWWPSPAITSQPTSRRIVEGETETFSVVANGTALNYQWQVSEDGGNTFSDLSNLSPYSNVSTAHLRVSNVPLNLDGHLYRCRISGACHPVVLSDVVELQVVRPVIAVLPTINVCPGRHSVPVTVEHFTDIASFSLAFTFDKDLVIFAGVDNINAGLGGDVLVNEDEGTVYLTWASIHPVTISGAPLLELVFDTKSGNSSLQWNEALCEFSNGQTKIIPGIYQNGGVSAYFLPQILTQPLDRLVADNQNTTFVIAAAGSGLTYRWQVSEDHGSSFVDLDNGGGYSGVTSATLSLSSIGLDFDEKVYRCRISGTCEPEIFSREASLTVLPNIVTEIGALTVCPGEVVVPVLVKSFSSVSAFSLSLSFDSDVLAFVGVSQLHSDIPEGLFAANAEDETLYISWAGTTSASLPDDEVLLNLEFVAIPGTSPLVWNADSEFSNINGLSIASSYQNGTITVPQNPVINLHPVDQSIYGSGAVQFKVEALAASISYHWEESVDGGVTWVELFNEGRYSGVATSQLSLSDVTTLMNGNLYRCRVSGSCLPEVYSEVAGLEVTTPAISVSFGQNPGLCAGLLYLPVMVTNANHMGAISLALDFNPDLVSFSGYEWVHPELDGGVISVNVVNDRIYISWASAVPANIGDDRLLELRFETETGVTTSFTWHDQMPGDFEFSDFNGAVIPSHYGNRSISVVGDFAEFQETDTGAICEGQFFNFGRQILDAAGEYTEVFKAENGCDSTVVLTLVVHDLPEITMPSDMTICADAVPLELTGAMPQGGVYSGEGVIDGFFQISELGIGTWPVIYAYTDLNGCSNTGQMQIVVETCTGFGQQEMFDLVLTPNPASDFVHFNTDQLLDVFVFDVTGRKVLNERVDAYNSWINVKELPNGLYLVKGCSLNECQTFKMVIKR